MVFRTSSKHVGAALLAATLATSVGAAFGQTETGREAALLPPDAKPGQCYARVFVPPTYETKSDQVLKREASTRIDVVPARYEATEERVLVREATERLEIVPATYEWVEERVLVKEKSTRIEPVPAQYETVSEQILDKPAHTIWKKGAGLLQKLDNATGEVMCLVEVPATYKTVTRTVLKSPATTRTVEIPEEYKTIPRQVQTTPATTRKIEVPAEYTTVKVMKQAAAPQSKTIPIPAEYQTVTRTELKTEGHMEWQLVLCETNASPEVIRSIQRSLKKTAGYDPGAINGVMRSAGAVLGATAPVDAQRSTGHAYVVRPGDTLWRIAGRFAEPGQDRREVISEIASANGLVNASVQAGREIQIP